MLFYNFTLKIERAGHEFTYHFRHPQQELLSCACISTVMNTHKTVQDSLPSSSALPCRFVINWALDDMHFEAKIEEGE